MIGWGAILPGRTLQKNSSIEEISSKNSKIIESRSFASEQTLFYLTKNQEFHYGPWDLVMALAWSPDGSLLSISAGDQIHILNVDGWQETRAISVGALTHGLAFKPEGQILAAGSRDGVVRIWKVDPNLENGEHFQQLTFQAHRKGVNSVVFNPINGILATGGNDAVARYWDLQSGRMIGMAIGGSFAIPSIDFSPRGDVLAVVNGPVVRLREVGTERIVGTFQADAPLYHVAFSPDGTQLAVTGGDNQIRLWQMEFAYRSGNQIYPEPRLLSGHQGLPGSFRALVWDAAYSPVENLLVSAGGDATIRLWDPQSAEMLGAYPAHPGGATCLAFNPDGRLLASGGLDGSVIIWSVKKGSLK